MSRPRKEPSNEVSNSDPGNRRLLTIWIIVITSLKILTSLSLLFILNSSQIGSDGFKIFLGADSVLVGTIVLRVIKYYFPVPNNISKNDSNEPESKLRRLIKL